MSLHTLANHLQSAGRGEDKVLVHMTPGEVKGLQSLAMAHGGSLTINPETGLPEAGILKSLLPMIAGFFLGPAGIGLTAMQAGLTVGALGTAATGSLGKGFMMGLGAYGGAGLGAGLTAAGAPASVTPSVANPTLGGFTQNQALANVGTTGSTTTALGGDTFANVAKEAGVNSTTGGLNSLQGFNAKSIMAPNAMQNVPSWATTAPVSPTVVTPTVQTPVFDISKYASPSNSGFTNLGEVSTQSIGPTVHATPQIATPSNVVDLSKQGISDLASTTKSSLRPEANMSLPGARGDLAVTEMSVPRSPFVDKTTVASPSNFDKARAGFDRATDSWEGAKEVWNATPKGTGYGLAATGMSVLQAQQEEAAEEAKAKADAMAASRRGNIRPYEFSTELTENAFAPRESTAENRYFVEPRFIAQPIEKIAKEGGLMGYAVGGPVEQMSAENAVGGNMMYPQSQLKTDMYSNPMVQRPMPNNVIRSGLDAPVGTYTGEQRFAGGGAAASAKSEPTTSSKYTYDPATMKYTETTTTTPAASNSNVWGGLGYSILNPGPGTYGTTRAQQAPQPTTVTETLGGVSAPYMPPAGLAAAPQQIIPNIPMQPQQDVNQQLGLEAFYPMMEQQLAVKGSQLQAQGYAEGGTANGGYSLGSYSDGGRLLRGPGDGVSDSIPASIGDRQPARLADGEFVVPARIVSEIGNGSTEAGARKLNSMMDRVQKARKKTVGKSKVAVNTKAEKLLPA
jgi:hypothetical protein